VAEDGVTGMPPTKGSPSVSHVVPAPAPSVNSPRPPRRRPGGEAWPAIVNGVLTGVGGVYVSTHSVMITLIAAAAAMVLAAMALIYQG
jgi:hypothetical protein